MIRVEKLPFKIEDYTVYKVISKSRALQGSFILDKESEYNKYTLPEIDVIEKTINEDFNNGNFERIYNYVYKREEININSEDPIIRLLVSKLRENSLNLILED